MGASGPRPCRGRFAPSPTGPLHFGSAVAALASFLDARARGGQWRVRIDDLDTPRNRPGAADAILRELERLALTWDGEVMWQSRRLPAYRDALARLAGRGLTFPCACTRREIGPGPYPGTCRSGLPPGREGRAVRLRVDRRRLAIHDRVQGRYEQDPATAVGDFVVDRADGIVAYHLAVVVDDLELGITDVVRGADLLDSTPRQILVYQGLGHEPPVYAHVPVAVDRHGDKLSKQTGAAPTSEHPPGEILRRALGFLAHPPPAEVGSAPGDLLEWAKAAWRTESIPTTRTASP